MTNINISIAITNAWENWDIFIDDKDVPDQITSEWLTNNTDKWEFTEMTDGGGDMNLDDIIIS